MTSLGPGAVGCGELFVSGECGGRARMRIWEQITESREEGQLGDCSVSFPPAGGSSGGFFPAQP